MTQEIMAAANTKVRDLGYDLTNMTALYDVGNRKWEAYAQSQSASDRDNVTALLVKHDFQAVYYAPQQKLTLGGDIWVFIDRDTKEVITTVSGR